MSKPPLKKIQEKEKPVNLFAGIPKHLDREWVDEILKDSSVRIERIVSRGQSTPPDYWYDQHEHEWVVVLKGQARLRVEGQSGIIQLGRGDTIFLPAHTKHRVDWTDPRHDTVWLALFWKP
jgi:cupin 2 domain-containing protein